MSSNPVQTIISGMTHLDRKLSTTRCVVPYCNADRSVKKHMFPKDSVLGELWLKAVNHPVLSSLLYLDIRSKGYWICCKHFSSGYIHYAGRKALSKNSVPTLFLPPKDNEDNNETQSIEAVPTSSREMRLENTMPSELFHSIHYTRSPGVTDIRRSSQKTSDVSPVQSRSSMAKKRQLYAAADDNPVIIKKLKSQIVDQARSERNYLVRVSNFDAFPEVSTSISLRSATESVDATRFEPKNSQDTSTSNAHGKNGSLRLRHLSGHF